MKYKGVIFDLDGTLLQTIEDISDSMNHILEEYNSRTFSYVEYKQKIGGGFQNLVKRCFPEGTEEDILLEARGRLDEYYGENCMNKTKSYVGIENMLRNLERKGVQIAINSNKNHDLSINLINEYFPNRNFVDIIGSREGLPNKPDPYSALDIIEKMGLEKEDVVYVGDSNVDVLTAKNAGIDVIGVEWGFRGKEELEEYGATYTVSKPEEILNIILEK